jgi:hypothetical protein
VCSYVLDGLASRRAPKVELACLSATTGRPADPPVQVGPTSQELRIGADRQMHGRRAALPTRIGLLRWPAQVEVGSLLLARFRATNSTLEGVELSRSNSLAPWGVSFQALPSFILRDSRIVGMPLSSLNPLVLCR